jgi:hypothetical protein
MLIYKFTKYINEGWYRMRNLEEKYISYIDEKIAEHNKKSEHYKLDDRNDEADLEKIKVNIYEIFRTLFLSDIKQLDGKDFGETVNINIYGGFLLRFDTIPTNWSVSLDKAIEHGDTTKQVIEEHKLSVAKELKDKFLEIFEEYGR